MGAGALFARGSATLGLCLWRVLSDILAKLTGEELAIMLFGLLGDTGVVEGGSEAAFTVLVSHDCFELMSQLDTVCGWWGVDPTVLPTVLLRFIPVLGVCDADLTRPLLSRRGAGLS